ncbi:hypothetical protein R1A27_29695 [Methylobacterium sp. NMS12]|uniref:hypothetical protein n=1 Tax=Methylobacterium sp. NMS12 TaxID=3079766 RepID=UPI003F882348
MTGHAFAILLAGSFTFGCAAIHAWREYAPDLTPVLAAALLSLTLVAGAAVVGRNENAAAGQLQSAPRALR